MSHINVAKLELAWDNRSFIKPINVPHFSLFRKIENVKVTWLAIDYGLVTLINEDVNYMYYKGNYYFLRKQAPLDENRKSFDYLVVKDYWMSSRIRKVTVTGTLTKTSDENLLWENLNHTIPITENLSGLARLSTSEVSVDIAQLMKNVDVIYSAKEFKVKVITKGKYQQFLNGVLRNVSFSPKTSNNIAIVSTLELTEIDSWKQTVLNALNNWLSQNGTRLVVGTIDNSTITTSAEYIGKLITIKRDEKKIKDRTFKTLKSASEDRSILTSAKDDATYIDKIDLSTLTNIVQVSPTVPELQYTRLCTKLFDDVEELPADHIEEKLYLRPKFYGKSFADNKTIIDILNLHDHVYNLSIQWNETEKTKLNISYPFYLEDWADGKYMWKTIANGILDRRMGFIPGVFSTNYKTDNLFRGLYIKKPITHFTFVSGIKLEGKLISDSNITLQTYLDGVTNIKAQEIVNKTLQFNNVGEDLNLRIQYELFTQSGSAIKLDYNDPVIKTRHEELIDLRKEMETEIKVPIYSDNSLLFSGTLVVNDISYGFYSVTKDINDNVLDEVIDLKPKSEVNLENKIFIITEPTDIDTASYINIKEKKISFGIRYCIKKEYKISPSELITNFNYGKQNTTSISIIKRLLKEPFDQEAEASRIHIQIEEFLSNLINYYDNYWPHININEKLTVGFNYWFFTEQAAKSADYKTYWQYFTANHESKRLKYLRDDWPKSSTNAQYILASEHIEHAGALYLRFPNKVLALPTTGFYSNVYRKIFYESNLNPYKSINKLTDFYRNLINSKGTLSRDTTKLDETGFKDQLIYEIYETDLTDIKVQIRSDNYYMEWWEPEKGEISYFDLENTNYFLVYKHPSGEEDPKIELILKDNSELKTNKLEDIRFKNIIKNDNLIFHINQINAIFLKGKIFPLKTKFDFRTADDIEFDDFYLSPIKPKKNTLFEYYSYKILNDYDHLEGNFKIPKLTYDIENIDAYQHQKLLLDYEDATNKRIENKIIVEENRRKQRVTLENLLEQQNWNTSGGGIAESFFDILTGGTRAFVGYTLAGGIGPALFKDKPGIQEEEGPSIDRGEDLKIPTKSKFFGSRKSWGEYKTTIGRNLRKVAGKSFFKKFIGLSGFKVVGFVGGLSQIASTIIGNIRTNEILSRNITQSKENAARELMINEFKLQTDHLTAEAREILNLAKITHKVQYSEISDTEELYDYLQSIDTTPVHIMTIYPKPHEIEAIGRIYNMYGVSINITDYEITLSDINIEKDGQYIIQMTDITDVDGLRTDYDAEYIKEMLGTGIKLVYMDDLEESFIEVETLDIIPDDLEEALIPKVIHDQCIADLAKLSSQHEDEVAKNIKLDKDNKAAVRAIIAERDKLKEELDEAKKKDIIDEKLRNTYNTLVATHQQTIKELEELKAKPPCEDVEELRRNYDTMADAKKKTDEELAKTVNLLNAQIEKTEKCEEKLKKDEERIKTPEEQAREYKVEREQLIKNKMNDAERCVRYASAFWRAIFTISDNNNTYLIVNNTDRFFFGKIIRRSHDEGFTIKIKDSDKQFKIEQKTVTFTNLNNIFRYYVSLFTEKLTFHVNAYTKDCCYGFNVSTETNEHFIGLYSLDMPHLISYTLGELVCLYSKLKDISSEINDFYKTDEKIMSELFPELESNADLKKIFRNFNYDVSKFKYEIKKGW